MQSPTCTIESALKKRSSVLLIDARSEAEFEKGHIPGAVNIPLLNNEQRKEIGTCYKQKGKQAAVNLGFKLVGPQFYLKAQTAIKLAQGREVIVYCWRGGMRSNISSWIYSLSGLKSSVISGGYKAFRNFALQLFEQKYSFNLISGLTGSGKTKILLELQKLGQNVIDLEGMASHRGSAYGNLGKQNQPSNEAFENNIAIALFDIGNKPNWLENESRTIGKVAIPKNIFLQMQKCNCWEINLSKAQRIKNIIDEYGNYPKEELINRTKSLEKKLGNLRMRNAVEFIENNQYDKWVELVLEYYDKTYTYGKETRKEQKVTIINANNKSPQQIAKELINETSMIC